MKMRRNKQRPNRSTARAISLPFHSCRPSRDPSHIILPVYINIPKHTYLETMRCTKKSTKIDCCDPTHNLNRPPFSFPTYPPLESQIKSERARTKQDLDLPWKIRSVSQTSSVIQRLINYLLTIKNATRQDVVDSKEWKRHRPIHPIPKTKA